MKLSESDLFSYSGSFLISYNDYLTNYSGILTHYLNEYSDNTELTFIKSHLKEFFDFNIEILQGIKELNVISESQKEYIYFFRNRFSGIEDVEQPNNKDLQYSEIGINQIYVEKITKILNNRITTNIRILEYLQDRESRIKLNSQPPHAPTEPATENEHQKYFINNGFKLFEYILNNHITENRGRINDISFYYWKMFEDNFIIQKPFPFVEWFTELYNVESFQIKPLNTTSNPNRLKHYSNSLDWFRLQNQ